MIPEHEELERLRASCAVLQQEIARSLRDRQALIEIRNDQDRDIARYRVIQRYSRNAILAATIDEFHETTVESIVEAFELQCASVLSYRPGSRSLVPVASFGFEGSMNAPCIHESWITENDLFKRADAVIVEDPEGTWSSSSLAQALICSVPAAEGEPQGALLAGIGLEKQPFFEPITEKLIPTFTVFTQQMGALFHNLQARARMETLNRELEEEITRRERAQQELRRAHDELEERVAERTAELTAANRAKSAFLANMSHELRTPMNAVIGFAEMILDGIYGDPPPEIEDVVGEIQQSGEHLLGLINDVLDITKIESGHMELRVTAGDLRECIETAVARLEPLAREKGLELSTNVPAEMAPIVFDRKKITQVLVNLVGNAVKFTATGSVQVEARERAREVQVLIRDTGVGIAPEELEAIFGEFHQVDTSLTRDTPGTGLGLAIAQRFIALHGGRLEVESTPGTGSTFTMTLPRGSAP